MQSNMQHRHSNSHLCPPAYAYPLRQHPCPACACQPASQPLPRSQSEPHPLPGQQTAGIALQRMLSRWTQQLDDSVNGASGKLREQQSSGLQQQSLGPLSSQAGKHTHPLDTPAIPPPPTPSAPQPGCGAHAPSWYACRCCASLCSRCRSASSSLPGLGAAFLLRALGCTCSQADWQSQGVSNRGKCMCTYAAPGGGATQMPACLPASPS